MIFKVITVISVLKLCAGEYSSHPQPHSDQAISSQSFVRHDVPLSYKFDAVHTYTTSKPDQYRHQPLVPHHHASRQQSPKIQYAPLYSEQEKQLYAQSAINKEPEKTHLEPKPSISESNVESHPDHLSYVPGYNVEVLQSVNRYPGHNAVYRSYPNMSPHEKINKMNFLNQYVLYQNQNEEPTTPQAPKQHEVSDATEQMRPKNTLASFIPKQYKNIENPKWYHNDGNVHQIKTIPVPQALFNVQEYLPHPKAHRLLLNIARTYNIAHTPMKAQHAGLMLKNLPSHTQAFIQIRNPAEAANTQFLSAQNKNLYSHRHQAP